MVMHARKVVSFAAFALVLLLIDCARPAMAHPIDDLSIDRSSRIAIQAKPVRVNYFISLAETSMYSETQQGDIPAENRPATVSSRQPASVPALSNQPADSSSARAAHALTEPKPTTRAASGSAAIEMQPTPPASLRANGQQSPPGRFTGLVTQQHLSAWFFFTATLVAMGLGALHALEPGAGKSVVGAYLVGSRGTAWHAFLLGLIVTVSRTTGLFALGAIILYASRSIIPVQLHPWLGVCSGIAIVVLGCHLCLRRLSSTAVEHSHAPESSHSHFSFFPPSQHNEVAVSEAQAEAPSGKSVSRMQLLKRGITSVIVPCPATLIVLLGAFGLHRVDLGFFLIVAFSTGLAAGLIGFGMSTVYARHFTTRRQNDGPLTKRWLPLVSSALIMILGTVLLVPAAATIHIHTAFFSKDNLGPILFVIGLGLILGMKHSTDADHVVAISTIVSKQRSIRNAAIIGSVWGLGHTITIFVVGALIILFGIEIPPRIGLSMEFSVAIMLVLLGILNLSGVMQRITHRFTPNLLVAGEPAGNESTPPAIPTAQGVRGTLQSLGIYQCARPLAIGLVHGLAGSAAVALLVLSTIHNPVWATVYLLIFGVGTMFGMMIMTSAIAVPLTFAGDRFARLSHYLGMVSGMVSLCFGSFLVYQLGYLGGLFTSHPQWTPR